TAAVAAPHPSQGGTGGGGESRGGGCRRVARGSEYECKAHCRRVSTISGRFSICAAIASRSCPPTLPTAALRASRLLTSISNRRWPRLRQRRRWPVVHSRRRRDRHFCWSTIGASSAAICPFRRGCRRRNHKSRLRSRTRS